MGGPAVAQSVRSNALAGAGRLGSFGACQPYGLVGNGLFSVAIPSRGKQISLWLEPAPMGAQCLKKGWAQRQVAILAALAFHHTDDHALAVDVTELETGDFGAPHAGA